MGSEPRPAIGQSITMSLLGIFFGMVGVVGKIREIERACEVGRVDDIGGDGLVDGTGNIGEFCEIDDA